MIEAYREILNRRDFIQFMVEGQQRASVQRTILGGLWYAVIPLVQIVVYYFLIVIIFGRGGDYPANPFLVILMGVMHYMLLSHIGGNVQPAVYGNATLLLQIKIEPIVLIAMGFFRALRLWMFGVLFFLVAYAFIHAGVSPRVVAYPFIVVLWVMLCWVIGLFVATAAVYVRDMERLYPIVTQLLMYASPVIYTADFFPGEYLPILLLNPIASVFALLQWSLLGVDISPVQPLIVVTVTIAFGLVIAHAFYNRGRLGFTKVL